MKMALAISLIQSNFSRIITNVIFTISQKFPLSLSLFLSLSLSLSLSHSLSSSLPLFLSFSLSLYLSFLSSLLSLFLSSSLSLYLSFSPLSSLSLIHPSLPQPSWFESVHFVSYFMAYSNSLWNPIIYGGLNSSFRQGFVRIFLCRRPSFTSGLSRSRAKPG